MDFSRAGAGKLIERFIELDILKALDENTKYGKTYIYKKYVEIFELSKPLETSASFFVRRSLRLR